MAELARQMAQEMVSIIREDPAQMAALASDPEAALPGLARAAEKELHSPWEDKFVWRVAVVVLGLLALTAAGGAIFLIMEGKDIPDLLVALGSAAVGALVGLFATPPSPSTK